MILKDVTVNWCKLLGAPRLNYNEDGHEWTVDIVVSKDQQKELMKNNVGDYFKTNDNGETFFKYRRNSEKPDGSPAAPVEIYDEYGDAWPQDRLIGNGSKAEVKLLMVEMKRGKNRGKFKPIVLAMKIIDHVSYSDGEGFSFKTKTGAIPQEAQGDSDW